MSSTPTEETAAVVPKENGKSKKGKPVDASRFEGQGQNFKAKLIGIEDVPEPRGEKMCQVAMAKLKAAVTAMGDHKTKIVVNVSLEGLKIYDEKLETVLHAHQVNRVSFIARDNGDSRAFGYIFNREDGVHQYFGIKTEKAAEALVLCMRDLFQTCFELKKEQQQMTDGDAKSNTTSSNTTTDGTDAADAKNKETQPTESPNDNLLNWDGDNKSSSAFPDKIETATAASSDLWFDGGLTNGLSNLQIGAYPNLPQMTSPAAAQLQMTSPLVTQQFQMTSPGATQQNLMTSPVIAQQQFLQQAKLSQNSQSAFAAFPPLIQPANPGMQMFPPAAWQSSPSMQLGVPAMAARPPQLAGAAPQNQSWTMFDSSSHTTDVFKSDPFFSSTPTMAASAAASQRPSSIDISSVHASATTSQIFTDSSSMLATKSELSSNATVSPQFDNAFSMTPLQPQPILPPNASIPSDPFAELTSLNQPSWKKVTKEDFIKEPPKPTLLDLAASTDQSKGVSNASDVPIFGPGGSFCHIPAPNTQMTTSGSLDKLHIFDFPAQKFSVLNDKRSVANAPIVQWPNSQTPPPIPTRAFDDRTNHGTAVERPRPRSSASKKNISPLNAKAANPFANDNPFP